jgi:hypothetical protein
MKAKSFLAASALLLSGCTPAFLRQDEANVLLRITKVIGQQGENEEESDFINSDVIPNFNDNALIRLVAIAKDPNSIGTTAGPNNFNDVLLERYEVVYRRSDGLGTEGVDVPYRISGGLSTRVPSDGTEAETALVVVRHQAKEEPPLRNLRLLPNLGQGGGVDILTVVAEITVHGRTVNGKGVTASGRLTINFADFAD